MKQCFLLISPNGYTPCNIDEFFGHDKGDCVGVEYQDDNGVWHHQWMDARTFDNKGRRKTKKDCWYRGRDKCCVESFIRVPLGEKVPTIK